MFSAKKLLLLWLLVCSLAFVSCEDAADASEAEEPAKEEASLDGMTSSEMKAMKDGQESHEFQAEVNRLMDIIINSLYSNREIFIRELISNAADASDKIRYEAITDSSLMNEGEELDIKIQYDKEAKTITFTDKGIGMTKDNLIKNLGIVAKSGTTEFLEAATKGKKEDTLSLIGQFGVGFYSVYLVADKVTVVSKHNSDDQYVWESTANSVYTIAKDPRGNTLGRGTQITINLKEDAEEFLNDDTLTKIVTRYSQFVNFPIKLFTSRVEKTEVPDEEAEAAAQAEREAKKSASESSAEDDLEVIEEEDENKETKPLTKTVEKTIEEWKVLNEAKAIWTRNPKEVTEQEYKDFYTTLKGSEGTALENIHFVAEGEVTFKSLLYIPSKAEAQNPDTTAARKSGVKLYVRRVLISDEFEDFLPRYMNFVKGVVDSDDLPLNVSRETLAQSRVLKVMSKKLVRKVLDLLRKMANKENKDEDEGESSGEADASETTFSKFWKEHGKQIKFGVIDDRKNKAKLTKLLRYQTSKSDEDEVSLESYVERMPSTQKYIYYITGESLEKVKNSPFLQKVTKKGYEVIFMTDPIDEYVVQSLTEFDGIEMQSVTKEGLKLGDEDKEKEKEQEEEFKPLVTWLKSNFGKKIEKVKISNRLTTAPCVLVTGQYGWSANMERIMKSATLSGNQNAGMAAKKTLEINPNHPMIRSLKDKVSEDDNNDSLIDMANLLLDAALLESGFMVEDIDKFAGRANRAISVGLGIDPEAPIEEETPDAEVEEKDDAEEDAEEDAEAENDNEEKKEEEPAKEETPKEEL